MLQQSCPRLSEVLADALGRVGTLLHSDWTLVTVSCVPLGPVV